MDSKGWSSSYPMIQKGGWIFLDFEKGGWIFIFTLGTCQWGVDFHSGFKIYFKESRFYPWVKEDYYLVFSTKS
jgi:hypothetical protein